MTQATRFAFTNRNIAALPAHDANSASKSAEYSDTTVIGLKAVVSKNGNKSFAFRCQLTSGRKRFGRIGTFPATDVPAARSIALEMRAVVDRGGDPMEQQDRQKAMPTFAEFAKEYMEYSTQVKKSACDDASKFKVHLLKKFGSRRLCDIGTRDIELHHIAMKQSHTAGTANRHLALLSALFRKACEWGRVDRNPANGVKAFKESPARQKYLSTEEIVRIFDAMKTEVNKTAVAALTLLILTGTRREETLQARWEHVDLTKGQWWLPVTKAGKGRTVNLNDAAIALLKEQPSRGKSPWVFPGRDGDKPLNNPRKCLTRLLKAANIEWVTIHSLRRAFATIAINSGATLYEVSGLLGHANQKTTLIYAHLADSSQRKASQKVADVISNAMRESEEFRKAA